MWLLAGNGGLDLAGKIEYFAGVVGMGLTFPFSNYQDK